MGKRKRKRFTAEDAGVHHKKLCVTDKFIKLLHRMDMMIENVYLGKLESGRSKGCRVRVIALESCVLLKIGANDGQQELKVCPDPRISVHFLCLTLQSRLQKSDFVSKVELQDEDICVNGLGSIERYDTFSSIFAEFKRRYPRNQDIDICRKLEQYFKVSAKEICDFWYNIHRKEAGIRHDTEWLKGEKKTQGDQGGKMIAPEDKPATGSGPKKEMILVSEAVMEDYQRILETKPPYIQEEDAYLVYGLTILVGNGRYTGLKVAGLLTVISNDDVRKLKIKEGEMPQRSLGRGRGGLRKYALLKANVTVSDVKKPDRKPKLSLPANSGDLDTLAALFADFQGEVDRRFTVLEEAIRKVKQVGQIPLPIALKDPRQALIDATPGLKELLDQVDHFNQLFPEKK